MSSSFASTTQAATVLLFGIALAMAPLMQALGFGDLPGVAIGGIVAVVLFLVLAAIELIAMHLLRRRPAKVRWIVRAVALFVYAAILFFTPPTGPMRTFSD
jgi:hypothetical protein